MARTRQRIVDTVTDRTMHAYLAGHRAGKEGTTHDRARLDVIERPAVCLHVEEQMAYAQLLPATWWAAFTRGHREGAATQLETETP